MTIQWLSQLDKQQGLELNSMTELIDCLKIT